MVLPYAYCDFPEGRAVDQERIDHAVEVAVDLGVTILRNGGSTRAADRTLRRVLKGCGLDEMSAAWRLDMVTARSTSSDHVATFVRPVGPIASNLYRVEEAIVLGERVAKGTIHRSDLVPE